eukprot:160524-Chlamydomonas_euryale.AAC.2
MTSTPCGGVSPRRLGGAAGVASGYARLRQGFASYATKLRHTPVTPHISMSYGHSPGCKTGCVDVTPDVWM